MRSCTKNIFVIDSGDGERQKQLSLSLLLAPMEKEKTINIFSIVFFSFTLEDLFLRFTSFRRCDRGGWRGSRMETLRVKIVRLGTNIEKMSFCTHASAQARTFLQKFNLHIVSQQSIA